jgi:hypothetical protein
LLNLISCCPTLHIPLSSCSDFCNLLWEKRLTNALPFIYPHMIVSAHFIPLGNFHSHISFSSFFSLNTLTHFRSNNFLHNLAHSFTLCCSAYSHHPSHLITFSTTTTPFTFHTSSIYPTTLQPTSPVIQYTSTA